MRLAQGGDQIAYADLLSALTPLARRYARAKLGDVPWVDDVVQETLMSLHRARHTCDTTRAFAPWFYAVASSRLIDAVRRERRIGSREQASGTAGELAAATPPRAAASARDEVDVEAVRAAMAALPSRQREIIAGMKFRDESVREVASRLGMSESAVKVTAHRGYQALKRLLHRPRGTGRAD